MIERIPLEERLRRLKAGHASSPHVTRAIADAFCRTSVVLTLEEYNAFYEREKLCELLKSTEIKYLPEFDFINPQHKDLEDVTYGDLALLIALYYQQYGTISSEGIEALIAIYFNCFEALALQRNVLREGLPPCVRAVYDFLHMSFIEYREYAKQCGLGKYTENIDSYRSKMGISTHMTPSKIFDELKMDLCDRNETCFDLYSPPIVEQCKHFIDFFICPVAMIWAPSIVEQS